MRRGYLVLYAVAFLAIFFELVTDDPVWEMPFAAPVFLIFIVVLLDAILREIQRRP